MPLITSLTKQNPLDINKDVTIGVALPLDETNMFKGTETTSEQSKTNLLSLLLTYPGERINLPNLKIREVKTTRSEDEHTIFISITYSVRTTGETDTIQINYN